MKLHDDFKMLREHLIIIRRNYNTYYELFFSGNDEVLIKTASAFFNDIAEIMQRDWVLQVCKIMGPPETTRGKMKFENITIKLIDRQLQSQALMNDKIETISNSILSYGKKLLPARHKRLAHFDREHQINKTVLGATSEAELHQFLCDIQKYGDEVGRIIGIGPLDFSTSCCEGDVSDLITVLKNYHKNS